MRSDYSSAATTCANVRHTLSQHTRTTNIMNIFMLSTPVCRYRAYIEPILSIANATNTNVISEMPCVDDGCVAIALLLLLLPRVVAAPHDRGKAKLCLLCLAHGLGRLLVGWLVDLLRYLRRTTKRVCPGSAVKFECCEWCVFVCKVIICDTIINTRSM